MKPLPQGGTIGVPAAASPYRDDRAAACHLNDVPAEVA
jgi:hypothetical protein